MANDIETAYAAAGAAYAEAFANFRDAYTRLRALEKAIANNNVPAPARPGFAGELPDHIAMRHPVLVPTTDDWHAELNVQFDEFIAKHAVPR